MDAFEKFELSQQESEPDAFDRFYQTQEPDAFDKFRMSQEHPVDDSQVASAESELVTPRLQGGYSPEVVVRGKPGRFDFNHPSQTGGTPYQRHLFVTNDGEQYMLQLEKDAQGGRWENAEHAKDDYYRYAKIPKSKRLQHLKNMWQGSPVADAIDWSIENNLPFEEMKKVLESYDTWRQISNGEPQEPSWYSRWGQSYIDQAQASKPVAEAVVDKAKDYGLQSVAELNRGMGSVANTFPKLAHRAMEGSGHPLEEPTKNLVDRVEQYYNDNAEAIEGMIKNKGALDTEIVGAVVGGAPTGVIEFGAGPMYAGLKAMSEGGGVADTAKAIAHRTILGKLLHVANKFNLPIRIPGLAAVGGVDAAVSGGDAREIAKGAAVLGIFGLMGGKGKDIKDMQPPDWWYRLSVREKGLVRQDVEQVAEGFRNQGMTEGQIAREVGRRYGTDSPYFQNLVQNVRAKTPDEINRDIIEKEAADLDKPDYGVEDDIVSTILEAEKEAPKTIRPEDVGKVPQSKDYTPPERSVEKLKVAMQEAGVDEDTQRLVIEGIPEKLKRPELQKDRPDIATPKELEIEPPRAATPVGEGGVAPEASPKAEVSAPVEKPVGEQTEEEKLNEIESFFGGEQKTEKKEDELTRINRLIREEEDNLAKEKDPLKQKDIENALGYYKKARDDLSPAPKPAPAPEVSAPVEKPVGGEKKRVGSEQKVMGKKRVVVDAQRIDGVDYELYASGNRKDTSSVIRIFDADSNEVVGIKEFPDYESAREEYLESVQRASGTEPAPKPAPAPEVKPAEMTNGSQTAQTAQVPSLQGVEAPSEGAVPAKPLDREGVRKVTGVSVGKSGEIGVARNVGMKEVEPYKGVAFFTQQTKRGIRAFNYGENRIETSYFKGKGAKQKAIEEAHRLIDKQGEQVTEDVAEQKALRSLEAQKRAKERRKPDSTKDEMLTWIAKRGGLDYDQVHGKWGPTISDLAKDKQKNTQIGYTRVLRKDGKGMSLDYMREALVEAGYLPESASLNDFMEKMRESIEGKEGVFSIDNQDTYGYNLEADIQEQEYEYYVKQELINEGQINATAVDETARTHEKSVQSEVNAESVANGILTEEEVSETVNELGDWLNDQAEELDEFRSDETKWKREAEAIEKESQGEPLTLKQQSAKKQKKKPTQQDLLTVQSEMPEEGITGGEDFEFEKPVPKEQLSIDTKEKPIGMSYDKAVSENMKHMGTDISEWSAIPVSGETAVETDGGGMTMMPSFDFPSGYKNAPSLFQGEETCQLCGHRIKKYYWLQNDNKKWTMAVGSECVTHFAEGKSGERIAKEQIWDINRNLLTQVISARKQLWNAYSKRMHVGYGRYETAITDKNAKQLYDKLAEITKGIVAEEQKRLDGVVIREASSNAAITRRVKKYQDDISSDLDAAADLIERKTGQKPIFDELQVKATPNIPATTSRIASNFDKLKDAVIDYSKDKGGLTIKYVDEQGKRIEPPSSKPEKAHINDAGNVVITDIGGITKREWKKIATRMKRKGFGGEDSGFRWEKFFKETNDHRKNGWGDEHGETLKEVLELGEHQKSDTQRQVDSIQRKAARYFGLTKSFESAGYITPRGTMLDLSGKNQGSGTSRRSLDHREVSSPTDLHMYEFMQLGNIRIDGNSGSIHLLNAPNQAQRRVLQQLISSLNGEVYLDLSSGIQKEKDDYMYAANTESHQYDIGTSPRKILNDIDNYYKERPHIGLSMDVEGAPLQKTLEELGDDLNTLARHVYESGKTKYSEWYKAMHEALGKAWERVRRIARQLYLSAKNAISNEHGMLVGGKATTFEEAKKGGKVFEGKYDKKERFEIDDSKAKIADEAKEYLDKSGEVILDSSKTGVKLKHILNHPELYKQYPEAAEIPVGIKIRDEIDKFFGKERGGEYNGKTIKVVAKNYDELRTILLHEIQHAIQEREGFARGGSPNPKIYFKDLVKQKTLKDIKRNGLREARKRINNAETQKEYEEMQRQYDALVQTVKDLENDPDIMDPYSYYRRLAGEIEARDTAARADMTAEERAKTPPYSSENIPVEDAIVTYEGGTSFSTKEAVDSPQNNAFLELMAKLEAEAVKKGVEFKEHMKNHLLRKAQYKDNVGLATANANKAVEAYREMRNMENVRFIPDKGGSPYQKARFKAVRIDKKRGKVESLGVKDDTIEGARKKLIQQLKDDSTPKEEVRETLNRIIPDEETLLDRLKATFSVEAPFRKLDAEDTGFTLKTMVSKKQLADERALDAVKEYSKLPKDDQIALLFVASNSQKFKKKHPGKFDQLQEQAKPIRAYFDQMGALLKEWEVLENLWPWSHIRRIEQTIEQHKERLRDEKLLTVDKNKLYSQISKLKGDIVRLRQLEYAHIPLGAIFDELKRTDPKAYKQVLLQGGFSQIKGRETIDPYDLVETISKATGKTLEEAEQRFNIIDSVGYVTRYVFRQKAFKDIKDAMIKDGLVEKIKENPTHPDWVEAGDEFPTLRKYRIQPVAYKYLQDYMSMLKGEENVIGVFMSTAKMFQFYNPVIMPMYDVVQGVMIRGLRTLNPYKVGKDIYRGIKTVNQRGKRYYEAIENGLLSTPYDNPLNHFKNQLADVKESKNLVGVIKNHVGKWYNPTNLIKDVYNLSWHFAWEGDKYVRFTTYEYLRDKGYSARDAAQVAAQAHADYASVPPKTRKILNKLFFTPTFQICMGKFYGKMLESAFKLPKTLGKAFTGRMTNVDRKHLAYAGALLTTAGINIGVDLLMKMNGWDDDQWGRKYVKRVQTDDGEKEVVVTFSHPANLPLKYYYWFLKKRDDMSIGEQEFKGLSYLMHPVYKIAINIAKNERTGGGQITNPFNPLPIQLLDFSRYAFGEIVKITKPLVDEPETTQKEAAKALYKNSDKIWDFAIWPFVFMYQRNPVERRVIYKLQSLKSDFTKSLRASSPKDLDRYIELSSEFKTRVENLKKQVENKLSEEEMKHAFDLAEQYIKSKDDAASVSFEKIKGGEKESFYELLKESQKKKKKSRGRVRPRARPKRPRYGYRGNTLLGNIA